MRAREIETERSLDGERSRVICMRHVLCARRPSVDSRVLPDPRSRCSGSATAPPRRYSDSKTLILAETILIARKGRSGHYDLIARRCCQMRVGRGGGATVTGIAGYCGIRYCHQPVQSRWKAQKYKEYTVSNVKDIPYVQTRGLPRNFWNISSDTTHARLVSSNTVSSSKIYTKLIL